MTSQEIKHLKDRLFIAVDTIVSAIKQRSATPAEIAALPEIARALATIHEL